MRHVEKAGKDVFLVHHPTREDWFAGVIVVLGGKTIGVVDSGYEDTPERFLFPFIQEQGRSLAEIATVVNTHRDGDHVLGNTKIKEQTGAEVFVHEADAEAVATADHQLSHGETIPLGDRLFTVIHTPGHTPGKTDLYSILGETSRIRRWFGDHGTPVPTPWQGGVDRGRTGPDDTGEHRDSGNHVAQSAKVQSAGCRLLHEGVAP